MTLVDEPVADGASRLDAVSSAADVVFAVLYGVAGLFCFLLSFVFLGADAAPNTHPNRTPGLFWGIGGYLLLIVALLIAGLKSRRRPRA